MGLDTQAAIRGHIEAASIGEDLEREYGATAVTVRNSRSASYKILEFLDKDGSVRVIDIFSGYDLENPANDDPTGGHTLIGMEFGPTSEAVILTLAKRFGGSYRRHDQLPWQVIDPVAQ